MRRGSGEGNAVLPWHVIREDGNGNRYRVGSCATRTEAQRLADRLRVGAAARTGLAAAHAGTAPGAAGGPAAPGSGRDSYLVEPMAHGSGDRAGSVRESGTRTSSSPSHPE
jgi:hypothetical protein